MGNWVLILIVMAGGPNERGVALTAVPFASERLCLQAAERAIKTALPFTRVDAFCVPQRPS